MRQKDYLRFAQVLTRFGESKTTDEEIELFSTRIITASLDKNPRINLFYTNQEVESYNMFQLDQLKTPFQVSVAHDKYVGIKSEKEKKSVLSFFGEESSVALNQAKNMVSHLLFL